MSSLFSIAAAVAPRAILGGVVSGTVSAISNMIRSNQPSNSAQPAPVEQPTPPPIQQERPKTSDELHRESLVEFEQSGIDLPSDLFTPNWFLNDLRTITSGNRETPETVQERFTKLINDKKLEQDKLIFRQQKAADELKKLEEDCKDEVAKAKLNCPHREKGLELHKKARDVREEELRRHHNETKIRAAKSGLHEAIAPQQPRGQKRKGIPAPTTIEAPIPSRVALRVTPSVPVKRVKAAIKPKAKPVVKPPSVADLTRSDDENNGNDGSDSDGDDPLLKGFAARIKGLDEGIDLPSPPQHLRMPASYSLSK